MSPCRWFWDEWEDLPRLRLRLTRCRWLCEEVKWSRHWGLELRLERVRLGERNGILISKYGLEGAIEGRSVWLMSDIYAADLFVVCLLPFNKPRVLHVTVILLHHFAMTSDSPKSITRQVIRPLKYFQWFIWPLQMYPYPEKQLAELPHIWVMMADSWRKRPWRYLLTLTLRPARLYAEEQPSHSLEWPGPAPPFFCYYSYLFFSFFPLSICLRYLSGHAPRSVARSLAVKVDAIIIGGLAPCTKSNWRLRVSPFGMSNRASV